MFTTPFHDYVCVGDSITCEIGGLVFRATILEDEGRDIDDDDCHNPDQAVTGCNDEQQKKLLAARISWFTGKWSFCGISISVEDPNGTALFEPAASLWGIECNYPGSDNKYLVEVAIELLPEAV